MIVLLRLTTPYILTNKSLYYFIVYNKQSIYTNKFSYRHRRHISIRRSSLSLNVSERKIKYATKNETARYFEAGELHEEFEVGGYGYVYPIVFKALICSIIPGI